MKEFERIVCIFANMQNKLKQMIQNIVVMWAALVWLLITSQSAGAQESPRAFLLDFFASDTNWSKTGDVWVEPPDKTRNPLATGTLHLRPGENDLARSQIHGYDGQSIGLPVEYALTFEFSVTDYQLGDRWEVDWRTHEDGSVDFLRCRLDLGEDKQDTAFYCLTGNRGAEGLETISSHERLTVYAVPEGEHFIVTIQEFADNRLIKMYPTDEAYREYYAHGQVIESKTVHLEPTLAHPSFLIDSSMLTHPDTSSFNLHWVAYTPDNYQLNLNVPQLFQTDERWRDIKLGHSDTLTIGSHGCLLTSVVMLLNSYGYLQFPNSQQLDVPHLNEWLKGQKDGYVNKTYLNMAAIMRLSNWLHDYYQAWDMSFPKFEYRFEKSDFLYASAPIGLLKYEPFIQEVTGHFVVGSGVAINNLEAQINDPYYGKRSLKTYAGKIISRRRFVPSFTDQSYLIVNVIGESEIGVYNTNGVEVGGIKAPFYDQDTGKQVGYQYLLPKPRDEKYRLALSSSDPGATFSLFAYNTHGEVATYHEETLRINEGVDMTFSYNREASGESKLLTWNEEDEWTLLMRDRRWSWQFARLLLDRYYKLSQYHLVREYCLDFARRGLLDSELASAIVGHLQRWI